ncbi:MAG: 50S ribosomal protein L21 [Ignavibacteria bacterium]|nr:50S ribosomal protein L21 [Ignavibacteria bacterium]
MKGKYMEAVVNISGFQFKVKENDKIYVPKLDVEVGKNIQLQNVLMLIDGEKVQVGQPYLEGKTVTAKVLEHTKDDKVLVFKKKRRKDYKKLRGHRQHLTRILIEKIN